MSHNFFSPGKIRKKQSILFVMLVLIYHSIFRIFEIHIPQKRDKRRPVERLDTSATSSGFISDVQHRPSTTHWEECLSVSQSQFYTWDKRGRSFKILQHLSLDWMILNPAKIVRNQFTYWTYVIRISIWAVFSLVGWIFIVFCNLDEVPQSAHTWPS